MNNSLIKSSHFRKVLAVLALLLVVLTLVVFFFPWDALRGPINRYVSGQLGRRFEITKHLAVYLGRTTTVRVEGVEIANPEWASEPYLLQANAAEFDIELLPLLVGKVILPRIVLSQPKVGLQIEPDGRRTWALARDTSDKGAAPDIGTLQVDQGTLKYLATAQGANVVAQFSVAKEAAEQLPLSYEAKGKWKNESFTANGRTGGVLKLSQNTGAPFPLEVNAVAGRTSLKAQGVIANLAELAGVDATFDLQGRNLEELYKLLGVVLPSTPAYKLRGKLSKHGQVWAASQIQGVLGKSDLSGALSFDQSSVVPLLTGKVQSKLLDFEDLGPVIGLTPVARRPVAANSASSASNGAAIDVQKKDMRSEDASRKVLPVTPLDVAKLKAMNADVSYSAADIRHARNLPLDKGSVQVKLNAGVLQLEPVSLGVAGGTVAGRIRIDANVTPAAFDTKLDVRGLRLNQLFPAVETTKSSLGRISGQFDLKGQGNSVAQMLGSASGDVAVLMGKGEISNILLEFIGLDGGEAIKFFLRGDRNVELRCAAAAFGVKQGLMTSRAIVLDTTDTVINGRGQVSLAHETLDLVLDPLPKDRSILSFRSPLRIGGTFSAPSAGPDKAALAGRAGIALALAAINPLLALAATLETGPGHDADCAGVLAQAAKPGAAAPPPRAGAPAPAATKK
ncbi:AsmA family protein [Polaromonas sp.]|uniref:AsmA family protein n=1 Tax=Polaromonas sp. TaxID=1869339 RepID=UPI001852FA88|nr:AsmA family protein [Polaromonas sp.]NMM06194.1 AsmA family protein [Polaromonas sp.]